MTPPVARSPSRALNVAKATCFRARDRQVGRNATPARQKSSDRRGRNLVRIDAELFDGPTHVGGAHFAFGAQRVERGDGDALGVDLEMAAERNARVAHAEAVG